MSSEGPKAYREEWEPVDSRPLVVRRFPFWSSPVEKAVTEEVVRQNPRRPGEGPGSYLARLSPILAKEREDAERAGGARRPSDEFLVPPGQPLLVAPQGEAPSAREPGQEG
jgi:hypothetical protein